MEWLGGRIARREFESFVADASAALLRTAYLMTWDLQLAEDLVQETFLKVARRWPRVRGLEHPVAYSRKILTNLALDEGARRGRRREIGWAPTDALSSADEAAERALSVVESRRDLVAVLALLPTRSRATLVLRFWEDLSVEQTADVLGCSVGTVKSTTSRALAMLRGLMSSGPDAGSAATDELEGARPC
jgi:RNA polymerase sigma-70 factor (sigma-E family)